jgi:DNA replication ATP-dependent helicase Dna2
VFLIRLLVACGRSVLLTSYTHSAVDNILVKLQSFDVAFLRIGSVSSVNVAVRGHVLTPTAATSTHALAAASVTELLSQASSQSQAASKSNAPLSTSAYAYSTVDELKRHVTTTPVVACSALSASNSVLSRRRFDVVVVDESSQITLPVCLGPLFLADKFVLVGDQYQLPPLVRSERAAALGLSDSLFRLLAHRHAAATVRLTHQYRMNDDVMVLANELVYCRQLRCGSAAVADARLSLPALSTLERRLAAFSAASATTAPQPSSISPSLSSSSSTPSLSSSSSWLLDVLSSHRSVVFINTDALPTLEYKIGAYFRFSTVRRTGTV